MNSRHRLAPRRSLVCRRHCSQLLVLRHHRAERVESRRPWRETRCRIGKDANAAIELESSWELVEEAYRQIHALLTQ